MERFLKIFIFSAMLISATQNVFAWDKENIENNAGVDIAFDPDPDVDPDDDLNVADIDEDIDVEFGRHPIMDYGFFGFGGLISLISDGTADCGIQKTSSPNDIKTQKLTYNRNFGSGAFIEAGYFVTERLIIDFSLGINGGSKFIERSTEDKFFDLNYLFANAQAKVILSKDALYKPYFGFGAGLNYNKINFASMSDVVGDLGEANYKLSTGCKGANTATNSSLVLSGGFYTRGNNGFMFDFGYVGVFAVSHAIFKTVGQSYINIAPITHSIVGKIKLIV